MMKCCTEQNTNREGVALSDPIISFKNDLQKPQLNHPQNPDICQQ